MDRLDEGPVLTLYRISAPFFVAGFEAAGGRIVRAAPILRRWILGRSLADALEYCRRRGWTVGEV